MVIKYISISFVVLTGAILIWLQKTPTIDVDKAQWQVDNQTMQTPYEAQNGGWAAQQNADKRNAPYLKDEPRWGINPTYRCYSTKF